MKINSRYFVFFLVLAFALFYSMDMQSQCAMCKEAAASSMKSNPNSMARSLNSGILYLMAVPYIMLCFIFRKQLAQLWKKVRGKMAKN